MFCCMCIFFLAGEEEGQCFEKKRVWRGMVFLFMIEWSLMAIIL